MKELQIGGIDLAATEQVNALLLTTLQYQCPSVNISGSTAFLEVNACANIHPPTFSTLR
jgi:hypothetical protein